MKKSKPPPEYKPLLIRVELLYALGRSYFEIRRFQIEPLLLGAEEVWVYLFFNYDTELSEIFVETLTYEPTQ